MPRILIVDDEPRNIRLIQVMLSNQPYEIVTAYTGAEALEICRTQAPDLVLLDILMPQLNGYEVCRQIKSDPLLRMVPVVMVTALNEVRDRVKALDAGADDFLTKPIDATELNLRVRSLLRVREYYMEKERLIQERLQFMSAISHDIRSPLSALTLSLDLYRRLEHNEPRREEIWQRIESSIQHIRKLATDTMSYYRVETGQLELDKTRCSIQDILRSAINMTIPQAYERGTNLMIEQTVDVMCLADISIVTQVMINLLTNAIKYSDAGSTVRIRLHNVEARTYQLPDHHYPPIMTLPLTGVVIEVEDEGIGIADHQRERVFREFDRLQREGEGVGLGMAVSQRLVRLHRGEIWFTSVETVGSTFAFFIPGE